MSHSEASAHDATEPQHVDPEHDIDGLKTTLAVVGTLGTIVFVFWLMTHLYNVMVKVERQRKIADAPTTEIIEIRAEMAKELGGDNANFKDKKLGKLTIEAAMKAYVANPTWRPKPKPPKPK